MSHCKVNKGGSNYRFRSMCENKKILIKTILATKLKCFQYRTCPWYETETQVLTPRTPEVDIDYGERADNSTSSRRLDAATHRESRDADSKRFRTGSSCQNDGKWTILQHQRICQEWKQFYSFLQRTLRTKEFLIVEMTSSSCRCQDRTSDWNWCILTCKTLVIELQVPSQQPWMSKSWVWIARGIEQYARQFIPTETHHQNSEATSSQQSLSCGRPRAQRTGWNSPVGYKVAPKPKLISAGFSQRVRKSTSAKALAKRDCEFVKISKHFTISHDIQVAIWIRRSNTMGSRFDTHGWCWAKSEPGHRKVGWCTQSF